MCAFPPVTSADNPPSTCQNKWKMHWSTCSRARWGDFFHSVFWVCTRVRSPDTLPGPPLGESLKGAEPVSSLREREESHRYRGEGHVSRHFGWCDNIRVCGCVRPLSTGSCHSGGPELEDSVPWNTSFRVFPYWADFLPFSPGCCWPRMGQEYPEYVKVLLCFLFQLCSLRNNIPSLTPKLFYRVIFLFSCWN